MYKIIIDLSDSSYTYIQPCQGYQDKYPKTLIVMEI